MATEHLSLLRCGDGYYRTSWTDDAGGKHGRSFGRVRRRALDLFSEFHALWRRDPKVRNPDAAPGLTVRAGWALFEAWAESYYVGPDGRPTGEADNFKYAVVQVLDRYGDEEAAAFGPLKLQLVREDMIREGLCLNVINARVRKIRAVFKWLVACERLHESVWRALQAVVALDRGRPVQSLEDPAEMLSVETTEPVRPVPIEYVDEVCKHVPPTVRAMIRLQELSAMRPQDVCGLRPIELDTGGYVWIYKPTQHKTAWRGMERTVLVGPKAQEWIKPYLQGQLDVQGYVFSPLVAMRERYAACEVHRHQAVQAPATERRIGDHYTSASYARCIADVCEEHGIPHWSPNKLRHNALTRIRKQFGLKAAQVVGGHARADVTQVYAEVDMDMAIDVMGRVG